MGCASSKNTVTESKPKAASGKTVTFAADTKEIKEPVYDTNEHSANALMQALEKPTEKVQAKPAVVTVNVEKQNSSVSSVESSSRSLEESNKCGLDSKEVKVQVFPSSECVKPEPEKITLPEKESEPEVVVVHHHVEPEEKPVELELSTIDTYVAPKKSEVPVVSEPVAVVAVVEPVVEPITTTQNSAVADPIVVSPVAPVIAPEVSTEPPTAPERKKGYILKQGHIRKNWKNRFFVLESGLLTYYEESSSKAPFGVNKKGEMILRDVSVSDCRELVTISARGKGQSDLILEIKYPNEREEWIAALREHIAYMKAISANNNTSSNKLVA